MEKVLSLGTELAGTHMMSWSTQSWLLIGRHKTHPIDSRGEKLLFTKTNADKAKSQLPSLRFARAAVTIRKVRTVLVAEQFRTFYFRLY